MKINLINAVKYFFPNPSLEMVYFEAVANSIDAGANLIEIDINIGSFSDIGSFTIDIIDNGEGFTDRNFKKFSNLLEIEEDSHKGIGRLVFLNYFKKVEVSSIFDGRKRSFVLSGTFDGENKKSLEPNQPNQTILSFKGYSKGKIKTYDYLKPDTIKKDLLQHFFPLLYNLKVEKKDLRIVIRLETKEPNLDQGFFSDIKELIVSQIPEMTLIPFEAMNISMFDKFDLYYSIKVITDPTSVITALCVDGRTIPVEILSKGGLPQGYECIFLLYSKLFDGKTNASRQELKMDEAEFNSIKKVFGQKVAEILNEKLPQIQERNKKTTESLNDRFPHLAGYFDDNPIGLIDRNVSLDTAQRKFFNAQKDILDSSSLSEEQFYKSLEISSRLLTEYILYRNIIIQKLKSIDKNNDEADIHNIIVPKRKTFIKDNFASDIFNNNAWLLDDKYMSYTTILSDKDMDLLLKEILLDGESVEKDETRPDIALVFSSDPKETSSKLNVVIVELKKLGLSLVKKEEVLSQLRQRARKLMKYFPNRIQRIWFYGIVDFDKEFIRSLKEDNFLEVFSKDLYFYKEINVMPDYNENMKVPTGVNILSFDAFLEDAEVRNSTFLNILKSEIKEKANKE